MLPSSRKAVERTVWFFTAVGPSAEKEKISLQQDCFFETALNMWKTGMFSQWTWHNVSQGSSNGSMRSFSIYCFDLPICSLYNKLLNTAGVVLKKQKYLRTGKGAERVQGGDKLGQLVLSASMTALRKPHLSILNYI